MKNKTTKIIILFFIVLSITFFITGIYSLSRNLNKKKNCTEEVIATCTKVVRIGSPKNYNRKTYRHYFEYEYNNKKYEIRYGKGFTDKDKFKVGKEYTIYVNPKSPSEFIIKEHENDIDVFAIGAPIAGISLTTLFTAIYIKTKSKYKED